MATHFAIIHYGRYNSQFWKYKSKDLPPYLSFEMQDLIGDLHELRETGELYEVYTISIGVSIMISMHLCRPLFKMAVTFVTLFFSKPENTTMKIQKIMILIVMFIQTISNCWI